MSVCYSWHVISYMSLIFQNQKENIIFKRTKVTWRGVKWYLIALIWTSWSWASFHRFIEHSTFWIACSYSYFSFICLLCLLFLNQKNLHNSLNRHNLTPFLYCLRSISRVCPVVCVCLSLSGPRLSVFISCLCFLLSPCPRDMLTYLMSVSLPTSLYTSQEVSPVRHRRRAELKLAGLGESLAGALCLHTGRYKSGHWGSSKKSHPTSGKLEEVF